MRRLIFGIILLLSGAAFVFGMPAYPGIVTLEDGSHIYIKGDEFCKWGETEEGYTILPQDDGWVYAKKSESGFAEPSNVRVSHMIEASTKAFLASLPLGIPIKTERDSGMKKIIQKSDRAATHNVVGDRKALVILMSFADLDFKKELGDFDRLFNEIGYSDDNAIGSVKDYFLWSSYGQLNFTCDVIGPFKASHDMKYYGRNAGSAGRDTNPYKLFEEALNFAIQSVNLKDYDSDNDGYVDNIHIIFAGYGEEAGARSDAIWSHEMTFSAIEAAGVRIDRYSCAPELRGNSGVGISRIGPHCHEMGHALGAMDYYDVDYSTNGDFPGTGNWDIMASGSWNNEGITPPDFNPYVKIFDFGWSQAKTLADGYNMILPSEDHQDQIYMLSTPVEGDFFLIENRRQTGFDSGIPGEGLLIFHVGPDIDTRKKTNDINSHYPQQCYIVCASANASYPTAAPATYGDINTAGCPYPGITGNNTFNATSIPAALCFDRTESGIILSEITESGDDCIGLYNGSMPLPTYIWSEDFESSDWQNGWRQEGRDWRVSTHDSDENQFNIKGLNNDSPIPHDTKYLYSKYASSFNQSSVRRSIQTPAFALETGKKYCLELQYYNSPRIVSGNSSSNKLNVYLKTSDSDIQLITSLYSTQYKWITAEIPLPYGIDSTETSFIFEGEGKSAGYICIDNIKLIEKKGESGINDIVADTDYCKISVKASILTFDTKCESDYYIYNISGRLVASGHFDEGQSSFGLTKGIFIIHFSNHKLSSLKVVI